MKQGFYRSPVCSFPAALDPRSLPRADAGRFALRTVFDFLARAVPEVL
jgi:hypothetical protein